MANPILPVGACGDTAPTGDTHPVAYARGVLQAETDQLRHQRDELARTVEVLLAAIDGAEPWEIDTARHLAARALRHMKDHP